MIRLDRFADELFEGVKVLAKSFFACWGGGIGRIGLFANKLLCNLNVVKLFKGGNMAGDISVGQLQLFFDGGKVDSFIDHEN